MNNKSGGKVAVLILFFNKVDQTIDCINSFLLSGQRIYVLNNGSHHEQLLLLKTKFKDNGQVSIFDEGHNCGVSVGRNYLIKMASEPWLFSVDNDITVKPENDWVNLFNEYIATNAEVKIISPRIYNIHENGWSQPVKIIKDGDVISLEQGNYETTNCFPGGASIIHKSVFDNYGFYDEEMFVGFEDYEFALRALMSEMGELKVHHVDFIQLMHDHRLQIAAVDKDTVYKRYDGEKHQKSFNRLLSKHNVQFEHDWEWWTKKQIEEMTTPKLWQKVKRKLKSLLGQ
jgi:glycosyltransferase involved in cell wall biosynthesis